MDRSLLSRPEVVAASRQFVCVRLLSYEDAQEMQLVKSWWTGRSGEVENTTVSILTPDGKRNLLPFHRSFKHYYRSSSEMAAGLTRIAKQQGAAATTVNTVLPLPRVIDVRRALNVAAGDQQPLVVVWASDAAERQRLEKLTATQTWSEAFIGRFIYVTATKAEEVRGLQGKVQEPTVLVVQPDEFGQSGKVIAQVSGQEISAEQIAATLQASLPKATFAAKDQRSHQRAGTQKGMFWETETPVTDPMERGARERTKRMQDQLRNQSGRKNP